ncbi:MAG: ABC transporter ATP-binding protein [Betaproteobacteria bacterium]|nr:ABC transporter ATP-binding protein [Betaproteobacteria bacterium]
MTALLNIEGLSARYGERIMLHDIALSVKAGEIVAVLGANGAGKTTLLNAIMGIGATVTGTLRFGSTSLTDVSTADRARAGLGFSPEGRRVFPGMTVRENLLVASRADAAKTSRRLHEVHALFPDLAGKHAALGWQLSGGQQQMLAIGRAMMTGPRLLLLDEPSLGLSPLLAGEVMGKIVALQKLGVAVLLAEQNVVRALAIADRGYVLELGRIVTEGSPDILRADRRVRQAFLGG